MHYQVEKKKKSSILDKIPDILAAPNVGQMPFWLTKEGLEEVVSHEDFGSWPVEAVQANEMILAFEKIKVHE
jgi:hypothetical protein